MSGSSTVAATGRYFRVEIESIRPRFRDPADEADWHRRWKAEHQAEVERLERAVGEQLPQAAHAVGLTLLEYRDDCEEILDELAETGEAAPVLESGKPFRYRVRLRGIDVVLVLARLPPRAARDAFKAALEQMVRPGA